MVYSLKPIVGRCSLRMQKVPLKTKCSILQTGIRALYRTGVKCKETKNKMQQNDFAYAIAYLLK